MGEFASREGGGKFFYSLIKYVKLKGINIFITYVIYILTIFVVIFYIVKNFNYTVLTETGSVGMRSSASQWVTESQGFDTAAMQRLLKQHWFGELQKSTLPIVAKKPEIKETELKLILRGIALGEVSDGERNVAVIENNGVQYSYVIGDAIEGSQAVIEHIHENSVLLNYNNKFETLSLPKVDSDSRSLPTDDVLVKTAQIPLTTEGERLSDGSGSTAVKLDNQAVESLLEEISREPQKLLNHLRLIPERKEGELIGYRIMPGKERLLFDASGLKNGDVVTAINGQSLTDKRQAMLVMAQLPKLRSINLTVLRNGNHHDIHIAL